MQMLAHPDGEIANARAAAAMNTIYILSTRSTSSLEEVAPACPNSRKWFQLYVYKDREHSENMIRRAEAAGFEALVFTVDCPLCGRRRNNLRTKPFVPSHMRLGNFEEMAGGEEQIRRGCSHLGDHDQQYDRTLDWRCLGWLKSVTRLPIIIKGILTPEDARLAISYGASGIFVSNHGGRQLDTVMSTIEALPAIVAEVKGECDVYLDGGVSTGTDVFKALALGAKMVFIGRPALWGLAMGGEQGAKRVLEIYKEELDLTMALAGVQSVEHINPKYVTRRSNL
jgi:(S)-2-hydroxy-acid oxidase